jgi:hypothetical protein
MGCEALNAFADTFSDPYSCSLTLGLESGTSVAGGGAAAGQLGACKLWEGGPRFTPILSLLLAATRAERCRGCPYYLASFFLRLCLAFGQVML